MSIKGQCFILQPYLNIELPSVHFRTNCRAIPHLRDHISLMKPQKLAFTVKPILGIKHLQNIGFWYVFFKLTIACFNYTK